MINEVCLLFYTIRKKSSTLEKNIGEELCSQAPYFKEINGETLILPEVSSLSMI